MIDKRSVENIRKNILMFTRRKVTSSPSLPKFKRQINVTDSTDKNSADGDWEDVEHYCSTLPDVTNKCYEDVKTLHSSSTFTSDEDYEDVETFRNASMFTTDEDYEYVETFPNASMFTTDEDYEDVEALRNASMFTTDENYEDVETLRNTKFFNFDTDELVVPSTKFLLDDNLNLGDNLRCSYPVASSTRRFSETSRFEKTNHHKSFKHIKEPTFVLPKPPHFNEEKDDASDIQLGLPKACSTFLQPQDNDGACDIHLGIPKACSTLLPTKEKELVFESLSCCQSEILSSFETLLHERPFASEIQDPPAKQISSNIANATESTATSHNISKNNYFSHKNSASTSYLHGSNFDMSELNSLITNSFPKICSKQRLEAPKRLVKDQLLIKEKSPIGDDGGCLKKNQHGLPKSDFDKNHAICCLSNTVQTLHSLKVMKPYYRTDVPIDDLCK
ncbi:hypothetical protein JTE90_013999 [Oedothorax gibbosus]|uniref:Uncharacterized protein n=1 Tax=Oedothorax gibbosus TaxID=931172 RepID=A0AAV6U3F9_9ARAC|nr:hypothetical protein JTE90_013999 [Oedothorax gibbosus]